MRGDNHKLPRLLGVGVDHTKSRVDRFSNLPDGVAHHILSFLTIKDLTRFGTVSTRCRLLYLSAPSLTFDQISCFGRSGSLCKCRLSLFSSLDRFLILRGDNRIQHFRVYQSLGYVNHIPPGGCDEEKFRIVTWIKNAVRCQVEVLELDISVSRHKKPFAFPCCVFLCGSLRSLSVQVSNTIIKAPSLAFASNLEFLRVSYTEVDEGFFKWISSSCKCIKELYLGMVNGPRNITIESPSLKSFCIVSIGFGLSHLKISGEKLEVIRIDWEIFRYRINPGSSSESLSIFAPNLKYLKWMGNTNNHQLGRLLHLEKAEIYLSPNDDFDKVFEVLSSINGVKVLTLHEATIRALFRVKEGSMPAPLDHISCLHMIIGSFFDDLVPAMVSLFRGMPNLSTLYIMAGPNFQDYTSSDCSSFDMGYWKSQNLAFISQLKEVTMDLSDLSIGSNGIEFSSFILEHAQNLKEMVIVLPSETSELAQEYILNKSKMTSNAAVVFRE